MSDFHSPFVKYLLEVVAFGPKVATSWPMPVRNVKAYLWFILTCTALSVSIVIAYQ